mmetsp:Transcript_18620/g.21991  ORF Transcript_18620/g.21991 Transcript_18620/m.21991 type:complete len:91 (-) Transcript_18620:59-331(-)
MPATHRLKTVPIAAIVLDDYLSCRAQVGIHDLAEPQVAACVKNMQLYSHVAHTNMLACEIDPDGGVFTLEVAIIAESVEKLRLAALVVTH